MINTDKPTEKARANKLAYLLYHMVRAFSLSVSKGKRRTYAVHI